MRVRSVRARTVAVQPGYLLGSVAIAVLVVLLVAAVNVGVEPGLDRPGLGNALLGIYIMVWGFMFLASYFYSHKSFFFRALMWVCEHLSYPATRTMALFYFALAFILGGIATLRGLNLL